MNDKPVEQIISEWKELEAKNPGAGIDDSVEMIESTMAECSGIVTDRERHLFKIIKDLNKTIKDYHAEMGTLIQALEKSDGGV